MIIIKYQTTFWQITNPNGTFTLHGTGTGSRTRNRTGNNGLLCRTVHTARGPGARVSYCVRPILCAVLVPAQYERAISWPSFWWFIHYVATHVYCKLRTVDLPLKAADLHRYARSWSQSLDLNAACNNTAHLSLSRISDPFSWKSNGEPSVYLQLFCIFVKPTYV